jgi:membrane protease YdiL (CAAX protease family)
MSEKSEKKRNKMFPSIWDNEPHSGLLALENADPKKLKKIRIANFIEPFIVYAIVLIVMWVTLLEIDTFLLTTYGILLFWVLFLSPIVHYHFERDSFLKPEDQNLWFWFWDCRGLGSARRYYFSVNGELPYFKKYKKAVISMLAIIGSVFLIAVINFWEEYMGILTDIGLTADVPTGIIVIAVLLPLILFILFLLGFPVMIRWDTLGKASRQLILSYILGVPFVLMFTLLFYFFPDLPWLTGGTVQEKLAEFTFFEYVGQLAGYMFWGFLQQLLFLAIFNTHFSRAFNIKTLKGKLLAALFTGFFFGLIHLPEFWLTLFTWIAGFFWALIFMSSKNLWAMGLSHGALATLLNKLTPIPFSVGPASM